VQGDTVTFTGESCSGATGSYRWSYDDTRLVLAVVDDPCADRAAVLGQELTLLREQLPYLVVAPSKVLDQPDYNFATVDSAGHFYTTDGLTGFYEYDAHGTPLRDWRRALSYTTGITVADDGTIYVSNFDDATIHAFNAAGKPTYSWSVDGGTIGPVGLAHDAKGNVYVALHRFHDHYIEKYSPKGKLLATWADGDAAYGQVSSNPGPSDIAVTPDGTSYLGDPAGNRVLRFAPDGSFVSALTGDKAHPLVSPAIVAAGATGNVFVMSNRTLWEFDASDRVVGRWFSPYDCSVVVDGDGRVWLVDRRIIAVQLPGA
jgi:DNA-binding beta-propeller fold protein YncE